MYEYISSASVLHTVFLHHRYFLADKCAQILMTGCVHTSLHVFVNFYSPLTINYFTKGGRRVVR